jgi:ABC-2 type transport system permease protein
VFAVVNSVEPTWRLVLLPLVLLELFVFSTALAFFLSALYVKFRDVTYIWEVGLQAAFYATPIIYPLTVVAEQYQKYFFMNPVTQIIQDARYVSVAQSTVTVWNSAPLWFASIPLSIVGIAIAVSHGYFKNQAKWFAENV